MTFLANLLPLASVSPPSPDTWRQAAGARGANGGPSLPFPPPFMSADPALVLSLKFAVLSRDSVPLYYRARAGLPIGVQVSGKASLFSSPPGVRALARPYPLAPVQLVASAALRILRILTPGP